MKRTFFRGSVQSRNSGGVANLQVVGNDGVSQPKRRIDTGWLKRGSK